MNKYILSLAVLLGLFVSSCSKDEPTPLSPIQVGTENADTLQVTREQKLMLLLRGGDGKYTAGTLDARIATASISKDTLRVTGVLNGMTDLTIRSHDLQRKLVIKVVPPPFDATENEVILSPGDDARTLSLSGGGAKATLTVEGVEKDAATIQWEAATGLVRIQAHYEGDIKLIATSEDGKTKKEILVKIRCQGESNRYGVYKTDARSISPTFSTVLTAHRRGQFVRFSETSNPVTIQKSNTRQLNRENRVLTIRPELTNPSVGDEVDLQLSWLSDYSSIDRSHPLKKDGTYKAYVVEVRERQVVLRGKGFKLVLPYIRTA